MNLSDDVIQDLNTLADWLSVDDFSNQLVSQHELVILAGHAIIPTIFGALHFASQAAIPVLLSGGIGHSTAVSATLRPFSGRLYRPYLSLISIMTIREARLSY